MCSELCSKTQCCVSSSVLSHRTPSVDAVYLFSPLWGKDFSCEFDIVLGTPPKKVCCKTQDENIWWLIHMDLAEQIVGLWQVGFDQGKCLVPAPTTHNT